LCKESDLAFYKAPGKLYQNFNFILNAFRTFKGDEKKMKTKRDLENF
jgi:hypothetical protein